MGCITKPSSGPFQLDLIMGFDVLPYREETQGSKMILSLLFWWNLVATANSPLGFQVSSLFSGKCYKHLLLSMQLAGAIIVVIMFTCVIE